MRTETAADPRHSLAAERATRNAWAGYPVAGYRTGREAGLASAQRRGPADAGRRTPTARTPPPASADRVSGVRTPDTFPEGGRAVLQGSRPARTEKEKARRQKKGGSGGIMPGGATEKVILQFVNEGIDRAPR